MNNKYDDDIMHKIDNVATYIKLGMGAIFLIALALSALFKSCF